MSAGPAAIRTGPPFAVIVSRARVSWSTEVSTGIWRMHQGLLASQTKEGRHSDMER